MMKKCFLPIALILIFSADAFCLRNFLEQKDYFVKFEEKSHGMAAILHVNFVSVIPNSKEAEGIVKQQLRKYGNMLIANDRILVTVKKKIKYKNIIGSAWYVNGANPANLTKIKFQNDSGAYVWIGKTKNIVTFPNYISFLKKSR